MTIFVLFAIPIVIFIGCLISEIYNKAQRNKCAKKYPIISEEIPLECLSLGDIIMLKSGAKCKYCGDRDKGKEFFLKEIFGNPFNGKTYSYVDTHFMIENVVSIRNEYAIKWDKKSLPIISSSAITQKAGTTERIKSPKDRHVLSNALKYTIVVIAFIIMLISGCFLLAALNVKGNIPMICVFSLSVGMAGLLRKLLFSKEQERDNSIHNNQIDVARKPESQHIEDNHDTPKEDNISDYKKERIVLKSNRAKWIIAVIIAIMVSSSVTFYITTKTAFQPYVYYDPDKYTIHTDRKCKYLDRYDIERVSRDKIYKYQGTCCPECVSDEEYEQIVEVYDLGYRRHEIR